MQPTRSTSGRCHTRHLSVGLSRTIVLRTIRHINTQTANIQVQPEGRAHPGTLAAESRSYTRPYPRHTPANINMRGDSSRTSDRSASTLLLLLLLLLDLRAPCVLSSGQRPQGCLPLGHTGTHTHEDSVEGEEEEEEKEEASRNNMPFLNALMPICIRDGVVTCVYVYYMSSSTVVLNWSGFGTHHHPLMTSRDPNRGQFSTSQMYLMKRWYSLNLR